MDSIYVLYKDLLHKTLEFNDLNQKEIESMGENPLLGEYQLKMLAAKKNLDENYEQIIEHHQKTMKSIDEWMAEHSKRDG